MANWDRTTGLFSQLEHQRNPRTFVLSYSLQTAAIALVLLVSFYIPQSIELLKPERFTVIPLVSSKPPVPLKPQPRVAHLPKPKEVFQPVVEAQLRVPQSIVRQRPEPVVPKPVLKQSAFPTTIVSQAHVARPVQAVRTGDFGSGSGTGSSAKPTIRASASQVQTGGFGDPNGVPATGSGKARVNINAVGSFDLPEGPGYGNGTGGAKGIRGVVASSGFGNGVARGGGGDGVARGTVRAASFGDTQVAAPGPQLRQASLGTPDTPVQVLSKPRPQYTPEARALKVEGEVLLRVMFGANGSLQILNVVRGLGHGLDQNAISAAQQIRFKPAMREGQAVNSTAVLHVVFQLAY